MAAAVPLYEETVEWAGALNSRLQDDPERYRRYCLKTISAIPAVTTPVVVCLIVMSDDVIRVILGPGWSEAGNRGDAERKAVMQTLLNRQAKSKRDLFDVATGPKKTLGKQAGRPFSSRVMPVGQSMVHMLNLARKTRNSFKLGDRGQGATHFMHVYSQRHLHKIDPKNNPSPETIDLRRRRAGLKRIVPKGTDQNAVWFWGK